MIVGSDKVDPILAEISDQLVSSTRDADKDVVKLSGEVLGLIGAIDPGRMELREDLSHEVDIALSTNEVFFVKELLLQLSRAFLNSKVC